MSHELPSLAEQKGTRMSAAAAAAVVSEQVLAAAAAVVPLTWGTGVQTQCMSQCLLKY